MVYRHYLQTIFALVRSDFVVFKKNFHNQLIDNAIVLVANLVIMGWILPQFGLAANFGPFMLAGVIASAGLFESYPIVATLVSDITGDKRMVSYEFVLPMPSWCTFVHMIVSLAIRGIIMSSCMLILGKLFLGAQLPLAQISLAGCAIMLITTSILCATMGLWIASMIKSMAALSSVWTRFMFPLWIFGGFQFSWAAMHAVLPIVGYVNLINPILYTTEGIRSALHIEGTFIPVWLCVPALIGFTLMFGWWGIMRLKKRLDFV